MVARTPNGVAEIIDHGEQGYLAPNTAAFVDSLVKLLANRELRLEMSAKTQLQLDRFTWPRSIERHLRVYAEALSRDLGRVAAVHARYADVAIMTRPTEGAGVELREEIIEGVLFHSGRPALIVPPNWKGATIGKRVVVAWDASREATRALSEAQALLEKADKVTVVTVDAKPKMFGHGDQPGANIAAHLSRRGLPADVRNVDSMGRSASLAILEEATALDADLVVMGGYAHSRLRELVFGGATRELLRSANVPLLMAH